MAIQMVFQLTDQQADEMKQLRSDVFSRRSYAAYEEKTLTLAAATKVEIKTHLSSIECVYLVPAATVRVYKDYSPEYWAVDTFFAAFDTSISQLSLYAPAETEVYLLLGGAA